MSSLATRRPISSYRPPPHRSLPPLPPRWAAADRAFRPPPLAQFVLLSMLLHALAILLFGAPSGGSREGRAMWGSLDVVITSRFVEPAPMLRLDRGTLLPMLTPPKRAEPQPRKVAPPAPPPAAAEIPPPPPAPPPAKPEPLAVPPLLDRLTVPDRKLEMAPTFRVPPPRERVAPPAPPAPPVEAPLPKPPEPAPAPRVERVPAEAPPVAAPLVQPLPPPPLPTPHAPVERAPVETPALPVTPTPPVERPPVEVPVLPVPESASPARMEPAPKPVEKTMPAPEVAPTPVPVPAAPPTAIERAIERAQEQQRAPKVESPVVPGPSTTPLPGPSPREKEGRSGDFPAGRSDYDPTKGGLDLDAMRSRAGQLSREGAGNRALLPFPMPPVEKPKSKLEAAIEKARKPDCKEAYKDLGLAAVIPLVANQFGEGSCRW